MSVEELLQMLQEKGMDDNAIAALLNEALGTINKDKGMHDEKDEEAERKEASNLFGVSL